MAEIVAALVPIFLLIALGWGMRRAEFLPAAFWAPAEKLTYYIFFPALLIGNLAQAEIGDLPVLPIAAILVGFTLGAAILMLALRSVSGTGPEGFTSMIQGSVRPNTYVGLAAAAALFGAPGVTLTAICIAAVVPLVNLISVLSLVHFVPGTQRGLGGMLLPLVKNPLILACLAGIAINLGDLSLPGPAGESLRILGAAALPLGLLCVGAGLELRAIRHAGRPILLSGAIKLVLLPLGVAIAARHLRLDPLSASVAVLYAALPVSASSYILARQMGGDAPLMARIITASHLIAILTLPLFMLLVRP